MPFAWYRLMSLSMGPNWSATDGRQIWFHWGHDGCGTIVFGFVYLNSRLGQSAFGSNDLNNDGLSHCNSRVDGCWINFLFVAPKFRLFYGYFLLSCMCNHDSWSILASPPLILNDLAHFFASTRSLTASVWFFLQRCSGPRSSVGLLDVKGDSYIFKYHQVPIGSPDSLALISK